MGCIVGVDPGTPLSIALIDSKGRMLAHATEKLVANEVKGKWVNDPHKLARVIARWQEQVKIDHVVIEHAFARSGQGIVSTARYVGSADLAEGVASGLMLPTSRVAPASWKRRLKLKGGTENKGASRTMAKRLWPLRAHWFTKASSHNIAEAALIAYDFWLQRSKQ